MEKQKLIIVSFIKTVWVLVYTAQKHDMKYQKNNKSVLLSIKNIINLNTMHLLIYFETFFAFFNSFSCFNDNKFFSDKERIFNNILITAEIIEEYNICGIRKIISYFPLLSVTLFIVESSKKKPLIVKYKEKDNINKATLREYKL